MAMPQGGKWNSDPRKVLTIKNKLEIIKHKISNCLLSKNSMC